MITLSQVNRFGSNNGATNYSSREAIPLDTLRTIAPTVFAEAPHASRSARYSYVSTGELLVSMAQAGFHPFSVMTAGTRNADKRGHTKHLLRLRHESQVSAPNTPEIVLVNSHDGSSSYQLHAGVFRQACANGLIVAESVIATSKVMHSGNITGKIIDVCAETLERLPEVSENIREMAALMLTDSEQRAFAQAAKIARYGEEDAPPVQPEALLRAQRMADTGSDLYSTLNRVQESLIRGGPRYVQVNAKGERERRKVRAVNSIDGNTNLNRAIWSLANEMMKIKATI